MTELRKINNKKEYPKNGLEEDCISKWRHYLCYIKNAKGIRKFVKRSMKKRLLFS